MTFSIEDHGFQCLVHTSRARKFTSKETDVTWVTQFTVDRIEIFKQMLQRWTGPVSAAVYSQDVKSDLAQLTPLLDRCDLHIVGASQGLYPVNTLRNVAINNAHTDYLLLADVDFVPAAGVHEWLQLHLGELRAKAGDKAVFVLPAFEINGADQTVPLTKEKLKEMGPRIHQVHNDGGRDIAHKYTMYEQWNTATEAYPIEYKFPYEPYFVAPKHIPRYDVRFFGYGNDKASQCYEMNAAGFEYWVLPEHFVVHVAHKQGSWVSASFLDPKDRLSKTLGTFLKDVDSKYVRRASKNDKKVFEALPAAAAYEVAVSAPGASCTQACVEKGKQCKKEWAERINSCKELDLHFDCSKGCTDGFFGSDLPAYNLQREQCLINNAPEAAAFNCDIVYEFSKRVCPCGA